MQNMAINMHKNDDNLMIRRFVREKNVSLKSNLQFINKIIP